MDRRQQKTRTAIFSAFASLLAVKSYSRITVQDIIEAADVGRSTFYLHFETKEDLLQEMCTELFGHILASARDCSHTHGLITDGEKPESIFCHLLQHLAENDHNILGLLSCESSDLFLRYFRDGLEDLIRTEYMDSLPFRSREIPEDFLVNHISGSFVEMVLWWIRTGMCQSPEELDRYFRLAITPAIGKTAL